MGTNAAHRRIVQVTRAADLIGDLRWKPWARPKDVSCHLSVTRFLASSVSPLSAAGINVGHVEMPATLALMFQ